MSESAHQNEIRLFEQSINLVRDPNWQNVRDEFLKNNPFCIVCGKQKSTTNALQVHHYFPVHFCKPLGRPDLELDTRNMMTMCEDEKGKNAEDHHILIGHLGDFKSWNPHIHEDAKTFHGMKEDAIKIDPRWLAKKAKRPAFLENMTKDEKDAMRAEMDKKFPK